MSEKYDLSISFHFDNKNHGHLMGDFLERMGLKVDYEQISKPHLLDMTFEDYISDVSLQKSNFIIVLLSTSYLNDLWGEDADIEMHVELLNQFENELIFILFDEDAGQAISEYTNRFQSDVNPLINAKIILSKIQSLIEDHSIYSFLYLEDIDSFSRISEIRPEEVAHLIPLNMLERDVKTNFCEIISELYAPNDWGGETSDLFTDVIFNGMRVPAAFMFKGRGLRQRLTIATCGTNGDQILRLVREPAIIYFVQHVNNIDAAVIHHLALYVETAARRRGVKLYFCHIDGVDTARLFMAYDKVTESL